MPWIVAVINSSKKIAVPIFASCANIPQRGVGSARSPGGGIMNPEQVFEILLRENGQMLLAYLRSIVRDKDVVDDLFQESMLVAWRKLDQYDRNRPFGAWLRGIARNLALGHFRERAGHDQPLDSKALEWLESRFAEVHGLDGDTLAEKLSALRDCVDSLPEPYRQPVRMRYIDSLPLPEIGKSLQLTAEGLKKRLSRAKLRLADCLERKLAAIGELT
jgi:RNA polymerase sigma-70 factor (ECF subfamily)